jgi:hypothetical protein
MTAQPADLTAAIDNLIETHATYLRCVATAVRHARRGAARPGQVLDNVAGVEGLPADRTALTVLSVTTARFVAYVAADLGIEPALLWARFSATETAIVAARTRPDTPAEPGEEDTQP